jgi:dTDP-4-dehydrorhamnose 3,5-epimerase
MIFEPTPIADAFVIKLDPRTDERGSFARSYCQREFTAQGIDFSVVQCNLAQTRERGSVRGLHYVELPAIEPKLVRCIAGEVLDVIIDMREDSPTRHRVFQIILNPVNRHSLFVPTGVAHGYQTQADETEFFYMAGEFYTPGLEKGVRFDDPALGIRWPIEPRNVADRDRRWPLIRSTSNGTNQ